jgi:PIN domain nuclease of toxin-antitoxin system
VRCLLDTHVLMWWWLDDPRLPPPVRDVLADPANDISVPSVCAWEIANKVRSGKLPEMGPYLPRYDELVSAAGFRHLDLRFDHSIRAGLLPGAHRDPFDRIIAGQALVEEMAVVTRDAEFASFGCRTLW